MAHRQLIAAALLLLLSAGTAGAKVIDQSFEHVFEDVGSDMTLRVEHGDGDVWIEPWDQNRVEVKVRIHYDYKRVGLGGDRELYNVVFRKRGDTLQVLEEDPGSSFFAGVRVLRELDHTYRIRAPRTLSLELIGEDGNVRIAGWAGSIACHLDDGDVDLADCRGGSHEFNLEDGDLLVEDSSGDFAIDVEDGDVELSRVMVNRLDVRSEDGSVDLDLLEATSVDWNIRVDDGDVELQMQPGISAEVSVRTDEGSVRVDLPLEDRQERRDAVRGRLHSGDGRIRIESQDGRVRIRGS